MRLVTCCIVITTLNGCVNTSKEENDDILSGERVMHVMPTTPNKYYMNCMGSIVLYQTRIIL